VTVASGLPSLGAGSSLPATTPEPAPVGRKAKRGKPAAGDDDMKEIEDILRQRGIS
jgi:hypothetical protein